MAPPIDPVEVTIGLLEDAAAAMDAAGRPEIAEGHRRRADGLRDLRSGSGVPFRSA